MEHARKCYGFLRMPQLRSRCRVGETIAKRLRMSWRRILFVVNYPSHMGPRLLRKLTELVRGNDAELELYQPAFEWGMHKGGIGSVSSDIETRKTLERRHGELDGVMQ